MRGSFYYYLLAETLAALLPKKGSRWVAKNLARIYGLFFREDLSKVSRNLQAVFPEADHLELRDLSKKVVENYAYYLVDLFYTNRITKEFIRRNVEIKGQKILDEALAKKKGVILASAHLGHWEIGGMTLAKLDYPLSAVAVRHQDPRVEKIFQERRSRNGLKIIPLGASVKECFQVLKKGEILALNADRLFGRDGASVDFLGKAVAFPQGISRLSLATGAQVMPCFFIMKGNDQYLLEIERPLENKDPASLLQAFACLLEDKIYRYPTQWFIFQSFWEPPQWPV